ncbi:MAG: methyltransferase, TIGR04325 family [Flavobacteriales bacterium]|jgi:putative methyltransferase (TIGR04325 family)|nr:methyltransferase, TIGR04325 family [Flavobacteriales bacterium]MBT6745978.1 methyltransferase, TIGR04325 family [Flavobacteriales bacterium]
MISLLYKFQRHLRYYFLFSKREGIGGYRGVYPNFEAANKKLTGLKTGYDHPKVADWYAEGNTVIEIEDYPILFWLSEAIKKSNTVFDFGGNMGQNYRTYLKKLTELKTVEWICYDLPNIIKKAKTLNAPSNLSFTDNSKISLQNWTFLCMGVFQYLEDISPFYDVLKDKKPNQIIIAHLPLHQSQEFVSTQNGGVTYYPFKVNKKDEFINSILQCGYKLIDQWDDPISNCFIPFHPQESQAKFYGFYFTKIL